MSTSQEPLLQRTKRGAGSVGLCGCHTGVQSVQRGGLSPTTDAGTRQSYKARQGALTRRPLFPCQQAPQQTPHTPTITQVSHRRGRSGWCAPGPPSPCNPNHVTLYSSEHTPPERPRSTSNVQGMSNCPSLSVELDLAFPIFQTISYSKMANASTKTR